ncbi:zinc finger protein ZAT5-like [Henckelia pumila]|uniref:zinc finger protein ZAT5-like n=1 Tax=Henckelia pumila TaxID=405737 RepID=UPI003C6E1D86
MEATAGPPMDCNKDISSPNIAKGKRTKRLRVLSPIPLTIHAPSFLIEDNTSNHQYLSPDYSDEEEEEEDDDEEESTTTEEEDTARCLILLANGHFSPTKHPRGGHQYHHQIPTSNKMITNKGTMYACKTCDRVFSSFQALGGHRASHKKPKNDKKSSTSLFDEEDFPSPSNISSYKSRMSLSLQLMNTSNANNASPRIHECSYCGAEFTSGQALGGHMRRHRAASGPISPLSKPPLMPTKEFEFDLRIKPKNVLSLDLNLPAPDDDHQR